MVSAQPTMFIYFTFLAFLGMWVCNPYYICKSCICVYMNNSCNWHSIMIFFSVLTSFFLFSPFPFFSHSLHHFTGSGTTGLDTYRWNWVLPCPCVWLGHVCSCILLGPHRLLPHHLHNNDLHQDSPGALDYSGKEAGSFLLSIAH